MCVTQGILPVTCYYSVPSPVYCLTHCRYAGTNCDSCDTALGYVQLPNTQICVQNKCADDSCGCFDTTCRAKIGVCSTNASSMAHCTCPPNYQGEHCEACKAGFDNWPNCAAVYPSPSSPPPHAHLSSLLSNIPSGMQPQMCTWNMCAVRCLPVYRKLGWQSM